MTLKKKRIVLEKLYEENNRRRYVHPDPLEFLYNYNEIRDREIAGIIASSLSYGKVAQILKSVSIVLDKMGASPFSFLQNTSHKELSRQFSGFKHRFATGENLSIFLFGLKKAIEQHGSLNECFLKGFSKEDDSIIPAMIFFSEQITKTKTSPGHLVPMPQKGSACKRMNLFLRWMVREDRVDPGGWKGIPISRLIIPLDTHMHKMGFLLGFTRRRQADMTTAVEITEGFRKIVPHDPVKYDFSLTRLGIRKDMDMDVFFSRNMMKKTEG
ncbi:MAG: TIGR02757 family protein [Desulfobacterales bacterium]